MAPRRPKSRKYYKSSSSSSSSSSDDSSYQEMVRAETRLAMPSQQFSLCACLASMFNIKSREELLFEAKDALNDLIRIKQNTAHKIELKVSGLNKQMRKAVRANDFNESFRIFEIIHFAKQKLGHLGRDISRLQAQIFTLDEVETNKSTVKAINALNKNVAKLNLGKTIKTAEKTMNTLIESREDMQDLNEILMSAEEEIDNRSNLKSSEDLKAEFMQMFTAMRAEMGVVKENKDESEEQFDDNGNFTVSENDFLPAPTNSLLEIIQTQKKRNKEET